VKTLGRLRRSPSAYDRRPAPVAAGRQAGRLETASTSLRNALLLRQSRPPENRYGGYRTEAYPPAIGRRFIDLLEKVRNNQIDSGVLEMLNSRYRAGFQPDVEDSYITLTSHNASSYDTSQRN